jgi:hypothetical protein
MRTKQQQQQQQHWRVMRVVDPAEAIAVGDALVPRTLPSCQQLCQDEAFVIIQLFPRGLTLHENTRKTWNKSKKMKKNSGTGKKSGLGGRPTNTDLLQKGKKRGHVKIWTL